MEATNEITCKRKFAGISGSTLKIMAIVSMLIDHIGAAVLEKGLMRSELVASDPDLYSRIVHIDKILRLIGRPAFPVFCFLLVEGFLHTKSAKKYALRLFIFALVSELPFDLAIYGQPSYWNMQNVYFTLLIGLLVMMGCSRFSENLWVQSVIYALGLMAGYLLHTDYGWKGVLLIELLYFFRFDRRIQCVAGALAFSWEITAPLAFIPVLAYNGKRGLSLKYSFYLFYPVHLLVLAAIAVYCAAL